MKHFSTAGITNENTKFNHVVGSLDTDVAELISDILTRPATATPFTDLKYRLIQEFEELEGRKVTKLLTELELGHKKPSTFSPKERWFLASLWRLSGSK
jgi:hypothetical protein